MKIILKISIGLNLILLVTLILVLDKPQGKDPTDSMPVHSEIGVSAPLTIVTQESSSVLLRAARFCWRQIESTNDYRAYVANLRAADCPEATVEDIVRGDVHRALLFKCRQLGLDPSTVAPWLQRQESRLFAELLRGTPSEAQACAVAQGANFPMPSNNDHPSSTSEMRMPTWAQQSSAAPDGSIEENLSAGSFQTRSQVSNLTPAPLSAAATSDPVYPLVFQKVNLNTMELSPNQLEAVKQIQQQFVDAIGGEHQNPSDPNYLERWQKAQSDADDALRATLGTEAYLAYQQQAYYEWYRPQVETAAASGKPLTLAPYSQ